MGKQRLSAWDNDTWPYIAALVLLASVMVLGIFTNKPAEAKSAASLVSLTPTVEITADSEDGLLAAQQIRQVLADYDQKLTVEIVYEPGADPRPRVRLLKQAHASVR